jgi:hypothetical protein
MPYKKPTGYFRALPLNTLHFFLSPLKKNVTFAVTVHSDYSSALRTNCKSNNIELLSIFNESQNARHILLYVNHYLRLL